MNKVGRVIGYTLATLGVLLIIGAVSASFTNTGNVDYTPSDRITGIERQSFMNACTAEGASAEYCGCTLEYLERYNTPDQIRGFGRQTTVDTMPQPMWDAVNYCISEAI